MHQHWTERWSIGHVDLSLRFQEDEGPYDF